MPSTEHHAKVAVIGFALDSYGETTGARENEAHAPVIDNTLLQAAAGNLRGLKDDQ